MSEISFEPPRGMRDFYPEDMAWRNRVFDAVRAAGEAAGFVPYDACVVESYELLARKAGEEVGEQIYHFNDKSDRHLALRAEMTPTLARMVAAKIGLKQNEPMPLQDFVRTVILTAVGSVPRSLRLWCGRNLKLLTSGTRHPQDLLTHFSKCDSNF